MKAALAVAKRELSAAFDAPVAYLVIVAFLVSTSGWLFFFQRFFAQDAATLRSYFAVFPVVYTFLVPALTMRAWADERRSGTVELLLTFPCTGGTLVVGKFLASFGLLALCLALTLPLPLSLAPFGSFDWGQILCEYLGSALLGAAAVALGLLGSSAARNQVSAFVVSAALLLALTLTNQVSASLQLPAALSSFLNAISLAQHFEGFAKGVVDTRDVAYFVLLCLGALFLNGRVLLLRKWS